MRDWGIAKKTKRWFLISIAVLLVFSTVGTAILARWDGHQIADWRSMLGTFLFGFVVLMMSWNSQAGTNEAKRLSEDIFAKHRVDAGAKRQ
jgi:hypothetical protein